MVHLKNQGDLSGDKWRFEFFHAPVDLVFNAERADGIFYRMGVALLNVTTLGLSSNIIIHHLLPAKPVAVGRATTIGLGSFSASEMAAAIIHRILQGPAQQFNCSIPDYSDRSSIVSSASTSSSSRSVVGIGSHPTGEVDVGAG